MPISEISELFAEVDGGHVIRLTVCEICGATFTQKRLSDRFLALARSQAAHGFRAAIDREVPDGFVPIYCPPCEHRALAAAPIYDSPLVYQRRLQLPART